MRYMNLILASTLIFLPTLAGCGDDAADVGTGDGDSESGTADESGTGNEGMEAEGGDGDGDQGDGDGDTGDGDGDTGDGDGDTGDGDGDTGDGDGDTGDGDGDTGDGDGDMGCVPADDTPCAQCTADNCCEELKACQDDADCACFTDCLAEGMNGMACAQQCMVNPMMIPVLGALRMCTNASCMMECGGDMP